MYTKSGAATVIAGTLLGDLESELRMVGGRRFDWNDGENTGAYVI